MRGITKEEYDFAEYGANQIREIIDQEIITKLKGMAMTDKELRDEFFKRFDLFNIDAKETEKTFIQIVPKIGDYFSVLKVFGKIKEPTND